MNLRKQHRVVAVIICLPLIMVTVTGLMLLMRNQVEWVQPKTLTLKSQGELPLLTLEAIALKAGTGVEQIIYRPGKQNVSIRMTDGREIQMHPQTGEIVKVAPRRSGFLIELHQGSWLGTFGQNVVHVLVGLGLLFLIVSGILIWPLKKGIKL